MDFGISSAKLLHLVLRPVVRFLVRRGVIFQEFDQRARQYFVEAAVEELQRTTTKINLSRVSVITGLQRPEVARYLHSSPTPSGRPVSLSARVLGQWEQDARFLTKDRSPRVLRHQGENSEFSKLCTSVSSAINPGTMLFELQRTGAVKVTPHGVKLLRSEQGSLHDSEKVHSILGEELNLVLSAIDQNIRRENPVANHHNRTSYDNIYVSKVDEVRAWLQEEGKAFHRRVRAYLAQFDHDVAPQGDGSEQAGAKVFFSSISMTVLPEGPEVNQPGDRPATKYTERAGR
jgi:hypothetical protein